MKLPLIAACLVAGSTWSFAFADVTASTSNQKTAPRTYSAQGQSAIGAQNGVKPDMSQRRGLVKQDQAAQEAQYAAQKEAQYQQDQLAQKQAAARARIQQLKGAQGSASAAGTPGSGTGSSRPHSMLVAAPEDDCSTPLTIVGTGTFAFDNTGATTGTQGQTELLCNIYGNTAIINDIWLQWTAPSTGTATYNGCGLGSTIDTKVAVYSGAGCPASAALACDDDYCGSPNWESRVVFACTAGQVYTIQLGNYPFGAPTGAGSFSLTVASGPPNDSCASATPIAGVGAFPFDNSTATTGTEGQTEGLCLAFGSTTVKGDVWYQWTAPFTGVAQFDTCGSGIDTKIAAYLGAGCPVAGTALACNDDNCGLQSVIQFPVTAGTVYTLQLGLYPFATGGAGNFNLNAFSLVPLDDCSLPGSVVGVGTFPFDTTGMTTSPQQGACGGTSTLDMWFSWTAPASGIAQLDTCGTAWDTLIKAYAGTGCPAGAALACNDDSNCGGVFTFQSTVLFPVTAGSPYMLQIGGWGGNSGPGIFTLSVNSAPPEDACATPVVVGPGYGVFPFDNTFASTGVDGQAEGLCSFYGNTAITNDVWFTWTASATGPVSVDTCGLTGVDTKIAVYPGSGCPVAGTALGCDDDACGLQSRVLFNATAGSTYTIQIGTWPFGALGGTGSFEVVPALPPANDDCSAPTVIGLGATPYDNTFATTGVDGQAEALCNFVGGTPIPFDSWFQFTAPAGGCTIVDNCASAHDSKIAVYQGAGCPAPGTAIACNDQGCGGESRVTFTATAGTTYTIQLGSWALGASGLGTLSVTQPAPGAGNDECAAATTVVGTGVFPFDNTAATTGCEGQSEALCNYFGNTAVSNDVWFTWTAPTSGFAVFSTCGSGIDTKIAAYLGAGCPTPGSAVACADDSCAAFSSTASWSCTAGTTYTLQIGNWPFGAPPGAGFFSLDVLTPPGPCDPLDDSTTENLWSLGGNSDFAWLVRFGEPGVTTTIDSIENLYGLAAFPGNSPPDGSPVDILLYADGVSQDGDPSDATLLAQIPTTTSLTDTDTYVTTMLPSPISVTGYFFAGAHTFVVGGQWAASEDTGSIWVPRSWLFGDNTGGVANLANPGASAFPPISLQPFGGAGNFCVRVNCTSGPATYLCTPGTGGTPACPCSNPPAGADRGCDNKGATGGASITGTGLNSLASPTLTFTTANENATVGSVLIQGTVLNAGLTFGHGIRCAAGAIKRLYVKISVAGSVTMPGVGDPSIPAKSAALADTILPGTKRWYQVYYRDTTLLLPGCAVPSNQFNVTNAAEVTWNP